MSSQPATKVDLQAALDRMTRHVTLAFGGMLAFVLSVTFIIAWLTH